MTISKNFLKKVDDQIEPKGRSLIFEFFITFSRFECALKSSIQFANGDKKKVEPNWDKFTSSISGVFSLEGNPELKNAVEFILNEPPRIQGLVNGELIWRNREFEQNTPDIKKLCLHIRDIRNNLFHGGKFNGKFEPDVSRNYNLINSALIILNDWLSKDDLIKANFSSSFN